MIKFLRWIFATDLREALYKESTERQRSLDHLERRLENQISYDSKRANRP